MERKPYDGFMGSPYAKPVGAVIALAICILILSYGPGSILYLLSGIILYIIPRLFHIKNAKHMASIGVAFLVCATLIGSFLFTIPAITDSTIDKIDNNIFSNASIIDVGDELEISVNYSGTGVPLLHYGNVRSNGFGYVSGISYFYSNVEDSISMSLDGSKYIASIPYDNNLRYIYFESSDGTKYSGAIIPDASIGDAIPIAISSNLYCAIIPAIAFFIILGIMTYTWKKAEEMRARLEAEGRLYPKGEGVCKECGRMILPGMTVCGCGAPIIPPEGYERPSSNDAFTCSECGKPVPGDAVVCPHCGETFED